MLNIELIFKFVSQYRDSDSPWWSCMGLRVVRWYQSGTKQPSDKASPARWHLSSPCGSPATEHSSPIGRKKLFHPFDWVKSIRSCIDKTCQVYSGQKKAVKFVIAPDSWLREGEGRGFTSPWHDLKPPVSVEKKYLHILKLLGFEKEAPWLLDFADCDLLHVSI